MRNRERERERSRQKDDKYRRKSQERDHRPRDHRSDRDRGQNEWKHEELKPMVIQARPIQRVQRERVVVQPIVRVNRKEICPFLVRVFYATNNQNKFQDQQKLPSTEIKMHLWMDSSLRQIGELLRANMPSIRTKQQFHFWRVHSQVDKKELIKEDLGSVAMHCRTDRIDDRYLGNNNFTIGDYIDVSINYK